MSKGSMKKKLLGIGLGVQTIFVSEGNLQDHLRGCSSWQLDYRFLHQIIYRIYLRLICVEMPNSILLLFLIVLFGLCNQKIS